MISIIYKNNMYYIQTLRLHTNIILNVSTWPVIRNLVELEANIYKISSSDDYISTVNEQNIHKYIALHINTSYTYNLFN